MFFTERLCTHINCQKLSSKSPQHYKKYNMYNTLNFKNYQAKIDSYNFHKVVLV